MSRTEPGGATENPETAQSAARPRDPNGGAPAPAKAGKEPIDPPRDTILFKFVQVTSRFISTVWFDMKVWGVRHVPKTGGLLLLSNHQSYLDPVLIGIHLPRSLSYMAKSELFHVNPFFTWLIRSLGAFPVRQTGSAAGAIKESVERLQAGHALNIYPEGSRTEDGEIGPIEKGVVLVVRKAHVPVVPVAIDGSFESWPKGKKMFHAHPIRLMYGPPMDFRGMKPDEIVAKIDRTLRAMYDELRAMRREGRDTPRDLGV